MTAVFLDLIGPEGMEPGELKVVEYREKSLSTIVGRRSLPDDWVFRVARLDKDRVVIYRAKPTDTLKKYARATIIATAMDRAENKGGKVRINYYPWSKLQIMQSIKECSIRTGRKYRKGFFSDHVIIEFEKKINTRWVKHD